MIKRVFGELPDWAKLENPILRYEIVRRQDKSESAVGRIAMPVIGLSVLFLGGYIYATDGMQRGLQLPYTLDIWRMLIFPLLFLQLIMRIAGLSLGVGAVSNERQRQTWDNLRATERGAEIGLRTRLVSVFYRLRGLIFPVMVGRIVLVGAILYELTSMNGDYLNLLTGQSSPAVSFQVGMILLAAFMTAFIVIPLTATGVDIAIGLLISTTVRNRAVSTLIQVLLVVFRVMTAIGLFWFSWQILNEELVLEGYPALSVMGASAIFADWGLVLSQLSTAGDLWRDIPYTIFIAVFMLAMVIVQVLIAGGLLLLAIRAAEVRE